MTVDESTPTSVMHLDLHFMIGLNGSSTTLQYVGMVKRYGLLREVRQCDECLSNADKCVHT